MPHEDFVNALDELQYRASGIPAADDSTKCTVTHQRDRQFYLALACLFENLRPALGLESVVANAIELYTRAAISAANANNVEDRLLELKVARPWNIFRKRHYRRLIKEYRQDELNNRNIAEQMLIAWGRSQHDAKIIESKDKQHDNR